jgi:hypothetical protein
VNAGLDAGYAKLAFSPMFFNGVADIEPQNFDIHPSSSTFCGSKGCRNIHWAWDSIYLLSVAGQASFGGRQPSAGGGCPGATSNLSGGFFPRHAVRYNG